MEHISHYLSNMWSRFFIAMMLTSYNFYNVNNIYMCLPHSCWQRVIFLLWVYHLVLLCLCQILPEDLLPYFMPWYHTLMDLVILLDRKVGTCFYRTCTGVSNVLYCFNSVLLHDAFFRDKHSLWKLRINFGIMPI